MINATRPHVRSIHARVGHDPRFDGSIHDDSSAATYGFESALVPGPIVTSYMAYLYVQAWGEPWLRRGTLTQKSRRPVYEGQTVIATADAVTEDAHGLHVAVVLRNAAGDEVASSTGGMPREAAPEPALAGYPHRAHLAVTPSVTPGGHRVGDTYGSTPFVYTDEIHQDYLDKAGDDLEIFRRERFVHPGFLLSLTMREAIASYVKPTPGVHVSVSQQNFNLARVGDTLSTSGHVVEVFEKKGNHYTVGSQLVVANGRTPIALFERTAIYALRAATQ